MRVLIAPDSFKGTISNSDCASAIAQGWISVRPGDQVVLLPMADGGEGTLETIALSSAGAVRENFWLLLPDGSAVIELALICGITRQTLLDPMGASTYELGRVLNEVLHDSRVNKVLIAVGGSASTDGGVGALIALGARFEKSDGEGVCLGGAGLADIAKMDLSQVPRPPVGGVVCLTDVKNELLGELGSARVFAPQKGANEAQVAELEAGLNHLKKFSGRDDFAGAGAAGGTPFGLSLAWNVEIASGAEAVAAAIGLEAAIERSDLVITGEGRLDPQSFYGKVLGTVTNLASRYEKRVLYCVGGSEKSLEEIGVALEDIAPTLDDAMNYPAKWLLEAGAELARREPI
jgi:glycerate kinase